jgi:hypothetical protein
MGAWPATIRVEPSDIPSILALLPRAAVIALGVGAVVAVLAALRRRPVSSR